MGMRCFPSKGKEKKENHYDPFQADSSKSVQMRHPFFLEKQKVFNDIFTRNSEKHDFCSPKTKWMIHSLARLKALCIVKVESSSNVNLKKVTEKI